MIPKFSVKKPYTVIVGIILVLVLGVVSLTRLSTDLLPEMNLPYAMVMTTYIGASPDAVETEVTVPVEESMATVSGIDSMSSISSENYSMVILTFDEDTDMDSITLEVREKLDQLEAGWSDGIGSPLIMKINPNMAPVLVASVDMDGYDQQQLTHYVNENLIAQLESIGGVASVSAAGQIEADVQIVVRQDKIDALNRTITGLLDDKFNEAQAELDEGKAEIEDGQNELESQSDQVSQELAQGANDVIDGKMDILSSKIEIQNQLKTMQESLATVNSSLAQIQEAENTLTVLNQAIEMLSGFYSDAADMENAIAAMENQIEELRKLLDQQPEPDPGPEPSEPSDGGDLLDEVITHATSSDSIEAQIAQLEAQILAMRETLNVLVTGLAQQGIVIDTSNGVAAGIQAKLDEMNVTKAQLEQAVSQKPQLEATKAQLESGIAQIEEALEQIESGENTLSEALMTINQSSILAAIQMGSANAQLASAEGALESAQQSLDDSKASAYDSLNADKLLTTDTICSLLKAQNFEMPAGYLTEGKDSLLVRVGEQIGSLEELEQLPLMDLKLEGLETIRLEDVADIMVTDNSEDVFAKVNGNGALILSMVKQDGYSTGDVSDIIQERFDELEQEIPGLHFTVLSDQGVFIDMVVHSVLQSMLWGALLAVIVLFFFLKDIRPTVVIACSIPVSVVLALVFMYMNKITLNMMSLGGLSLGIGMLVDNSVVVLENIYRYRHLGYDSRSASVAGAKEVSGAIIASTLTTVCVFTGLFFTSGMVADLMVPMALTILFSLVGSLIIALTFVPMMSSLTMGRTHTIKHPIYDRFAVLYRSFLGLCLRIKPVVIVLAVVLFAVTGRAAISKGFIFMPEMESDQASVSLTAPEGTSFEDTMVMAEEAAEIMMTIPDVETVGVQSGSSSMMNMVVSSSFGGMSGGSGEDNSATFYLVFAEERTQTNEQFKEQVLEKTAHLDCDISVETASMDMSAMMGSGITVRLYGRDKEQLQNTAADLGAKIRTLEGVSEVDDGLTEASEQLKVTVNKAEAAKHGLTVAQVFQSIAAKIATPTPQTRLELSDGNFDVYVKKDTDEEMTRNQLGEISFESTDSEGKKTQIELTDVADITTTTGLDVINRYNQQRYLSLTVYVKEGWNVTKVSDALEQMVADYPFPAGCYMDLSGESETIMDAMMQLVEMLLLAVVCIYLIMVAQFQSLKHPFIIMFTIPLAFTGGFIALLLTRAEISVIAMIGFVMLAGVIVNNGIVMVDYINRLRKKGMDKHEAILQAGQTRLRPVLMTTLTTVFAMFFMAMGDSMDAAMLRPMAVVTIGGLTYGTLMTLIFVPCVYDLFNSNKSMVEQEINDTIIEE